MEAKTIRTIHGKEFNFYRKGNDGNGNPVYFVSWLSLGLSSYEATAQTRAAGLKKFTGKAFGGGFTFQSYSLENSADFFEEKGLGLSMPKLKTNSKQVRQAIQDYIVDSLDTMDFDGHDGTVKKSLEIVLHDFAKAALYPNNLKHLGSYQACFVDWICGLPTCLSIEFRTHAILKKMAAWGLPLPANKEETEGELLFRNLIYMNLIDLAKKNKIDYMKIFNGAN